MSNNNRIKHWRQARGLSLQQLADKTGTSKSQIDKLERGERRLTVDWMVRLAGPLMCDPRELLPFSQGVSNTRQELIPVLGPDLKEPIDQVPRPYFLAHTKDAYAVYVEDASMAPMYRPRQLVFVNPHKPLAVGHGVVVVVKHGAVLIRECVAQRPAEIVVREHHPKVRETSIKSNDIIAMHAIVGATEPS